MRAIRSDSEQVIFDERCRDPEPPEGEALVRVVRAGVARADLALARQPERFVGVLGREFVGVVEVVNSREPADRSRVGTRVVASTSVSCGVCDLCKGGLGNHCRKRQVLGARGRDGCFADLVSVPLANLVAVPDGVDDDAAVLAEPLAAAIHAGRMIRLEHKPYVTVLGDGPAGLLAVQVMSKLNASVRLLGREPSKFSLCEKWGIKHRHVEEVGLRGDQDVVLDCTNDASGLSTALGLVRPRGTVIVTSPVASGVDLSPVVEHEIELVGARNGKLHDAVRTMSEGGVDTLSLITKRVMLADGINALNAAARPDQIRVVMSI